VYTILASVVKGEGWLVYRQWGEQSPSAYKAHTTDIIEHIALGYNLITEKRQIISQNT